MGIIDSQVFMGIDRQMHMAIEEQTEKTKLGVGEDD